MAESINIGDVVLATCGRDKDKYFLVVDVNDRNAFIVDGRDRKVTAVKKKNVKHLKSVKVAVLKDIAIRLQKGQPVGNDKLFKAIKSELQKKQED